MITVPTPAFASVCVRVPSATEANRLFLAFVIVLSVSTDEMLKDTDNSADTTGSLARRLVTGTPALDRKSARLLSVELAIRVMLATAVAAAFESVPKPLITNDTARPPSSCANRRRPWLGGRTLIFIKSKPKSAASP